jgi:predicted ATPase
LIVILEGPDGAGKTHLAHQLHQRWQTVYHHAGPPKDEPNLLEHYALQVQKARLDGMNHVFDRLALGEMVYGPILRGKDRLGSAGWTVFKRLLNAASVRRVLCLPRYETCLKNWSSKEELIQDRATFDRTVQAWSFIQRIDDQMFVYDYENPRMFDALMVHIDPSVSSGPLPHHMVGSPYADYLVVGQRGSNLNSQLDLPFFGVTDSSRYLNDALQEAGFEEHELAFMNAFPARSVMARRIPTTYKRVIALGEEASDVCASQGVEHDHIPHPQYWRRFKHHSQSTYAGLLQGSRVEAE